jgi:Leucine-rich repeat (LRR) protein
LGEQFGSKGNRLTTLPESITRLAQLQSLSLDNNQLSTLPESITHLEKLQSLSLDNNQLNTLPNWIARNVSRKERQKSERKYP